VPVEAWLRGADKEISRDEENTVILQLDILRNIHIDLHKVGQVRIDNPTNDQLLLLKLSTYLLKRKK
jgi:hypothetical protein